MPEINDDETNTLILDQLKQDARQSIRQIAKKTRLRPSTVHNRITKMHDDGLIEKFTVKLNDKLARQNFIVFILINSDKLIPDSYFRNPYIKEVFGVTGEYDLMMKCKFPGIDEFNEFILEFRKLTQVVKTHTLVGTTTIKEEI